LRSAGVAVVLDNEGQGGSPLVQHEMVEVLVRGRHRALPQFGPAICAATQGPGAKAGVDAVESGVEAPVPGAVQGAVRAAVEEVLLHRLRGAQF
jgi:hypothetical protein